MRKAYVWKRGGVAKILHTDIAEMQKRKDEWWQKYIEAETQEEEGDAQRSIDEINGYLLACRRAVALLEAEVKRG